MGSKIKNGLVFGAGISMALSSCGSRVENHTESEIRMFAAVEPHVTSAVIIDEVAVTSAAKTAVVAALSEEFSPTPEINPTFVGDDVVISPEDDPNCAVQLTFYFDRSVLLPNVNIAFVAPPDVFRGSDEAYTLALFSNEYSHTETSEEVVDGKFIDLSNPQTIADAAAFITSLAGLTCPDPTS